MAEAALIDPGDAAWAGALSRVRHDVYHLPGYVRLDAGLSGARPVAFRYAEAGRVLLIPLLLRDIPDTDLLDAISPYGYPGPVTDTGGDDEGFWSRGGRAMAELLCTRRVITAFIRLHPLLDQPPPAFTGTGTVVHHGETVSIDLRRSADEIWRQTHRSHRNQINKAKRAGIRIVIDDWDRLDEWIATYHATMRRVGATDFYLFPAGHFHRLRTALAEAVHLAVAVDGDDVVLGGNLFFEYGGIMHTHLQSTRDGEIRYADKLLYHEVRMWGRDRGNEIYHLGGGVGGQADSLFRYKAAFAAGRHRFGTWRVITDPGSYAKLAGPPTPEALSGRFPAYR